MPGLVVLVEFEIKPDRVDEFFKLVCINAAASFRDEPGCRKFDVMREPSNPARANVITLYEIYDDEAAFEAHQRTSHFATFSKAIDGMELGRAIRKFDVWENGST